MPVQISPLERLHVAEECLAHWAESDYENADIWAQLARLAPEKLAPAIVLKSDGAPFVGYVFERLEKSIRILVPRKQWHFTRIRRSSDLVVLSPRERRSHTYCAELQRELSGAIADLMSKAHGVSNKKRTRGTAPGEDKAPKVSDA